MSGPALGVNHCPGKLTLKGVKLAWFWEGGNVNSLEEDLEREKDDAGRGTWREGCAH